MVGRPALAEIGVLPVHATNVCEGAADGNHAAAGSSAQELPEHRGNEVVTEVVHAKLQLEALRGLTVGRSHYAGVVHEYVEPSERAVQIRGGIAYTLKVREIHEETTVSARRCILL